MRMPPLSLLRTFEAAARQRSFKAAAEELSVTPAAISQQIRALEEFLDIELFHRRVRRVELTEAGADYLRGVGDGLNTLMAATRRLREPRLAGPLRIATMPSFAMHWLIPRLPSFRERYPSIEVAIDASTTLANLHRGEADLAIRFGTGHYPGLRVHLLMADSIFPVCSARLLSDRIPKRTSDLLSFTLIHDTSASNSEPWAHWTTWLRDAPDQSAPKGHLHVSDANLAIEAALMGQGVTLGRRSIAAELLRSGWLVRPIPSAVRETDFAYYMVATDASFDSPRTTAFRLWLEEQINDA